MAAVVNPRRGPCSVIGWPTPGRALGTRGPRSQCRGARPVPHHPSPPPHARNVGPISWRAWQSPAFPKQPSPAHGCSGMSSVDVSVLKEARHKCHTVRAWAGWGCRDAGPSMLRVPPHHAFEISPDCVAMQARDAFYECVEGCAVLFQVGQDPPKPCRALRKAFEASCKPSWVRRSWRRMGCVRANGVHGDLWCCRLSRDGFDGSVPAGTTVASAPTHGPERALPRPLTPPIPKHAGKTF